MPPTEIYQRGLQLHAEANELAGANGSAVSSYTDLSGHGRHLVAASSQPTILTGAINGKKSVVSDGTKNPLVYNGDITINCGFMVAKVNGNFGATVHRGILSSKENFGLLSGIPGTGNLYDFNYQYWEYRMNDQIYSRTPTHLNGEYTNALVAPGPISAFKIIFFRLFSSVTLDGVQIFKDRSISGSGLNGSIPFLALYDRNFQEYEIRNNQRSIAFSYQLGLADVFPFVASKGDGKTLSKRILTDEQDEPNTRVKRGKRAYFDLNFNVRSLEEENKAMAFWDEHHPAKRFLYRDTNRIPHVDTIVRFPETAEPEITPVVMNRYNYAFPVIESTTAPSFYVPAAAPDIPDETPPTVEIFAPEIDPLGHNGLLEISADASDETGVASVRWFVDGEFAAQIFADPWTFEWDTTTVPDGIHHVKAIAYDAKGNESIPDEISLEVNNYVNLALTSYGGTISATSTLTPGTYPASSVIDGIRHTNNAWSTGGGWSSNTDASVKTKEGVTIDLGATRIIEEIKVWTLADSVNYNTDPDSEATFTLFGNTNFDIDYWNGSAWVNIVTISSNNKVLRAPAFAPVTGSKVRVMVSGAAGGKARLIEVEVWGNLA